MPRWAKTRLTGWGRVSSAESLAARPERIADVAKAMRDAGSETLLAYGAGRSYGDTALNSRGRAVLTRRLDRLLSLDRATSVLETEPGVTFTEVIDAVLPSGFMPTVVPGTGFATLGGGIANDVHGKNHHVVGSFGQHLLWFDLRTPSGDIVRVDPQQQPELFKATVGGIGLTGIVERLAIRLMPVPSDAVHVRKTRIPDLDAFLAAFEREKAQSHYVVGWIDALAKGRSLGRGILETANPASVSVAARKSKSKRVPIDFPSIALNPLSVRAFNWFYRRHISARGWEGTMPYQSFLFPLDAIHDWNRIYGKRGFRQFQCVVPFESGQRALVKMLEEIAAVGRGSFLAVLKAMGPQGIGHLSFGMPGYTLALDFPNSPGVLEFLARLERITADHGGRVYLAKDSSVSAPIFKSMYPAAADMSALLHRLDPQRRMRSDLAARIGLFADAHG